MHSYGHHGLFNPAVISNKEAHMIYGSMNKEAGSTQSYWFWQEEKAENFWLFSQTEQRSIEGYFGLSMLYLTYGEMRAYYYVCASHSKYMII